MLNYLGPNIGPTGPVTNVLPPATPGTMPDGVPGLPTAPEPPPPIQLHGAPPPPSALAAIANRPSGGPNAAPVPAPPPPPPDYGTTTQDDGSILLHIRNPDGSLGPVVKVIPPIKRPGDNKPA